MSSGGGGSADAANLAESRGPAASALPSLAAAGASSAVSALAMTGAPVWPLVLTGLTLLVLGAGSRRAGKAVAARV